MDDIQRRQELSNFLKTRRARLSPIDVGFADNSRRRTPGLRREEVAQLANVSSTWYTWLEQGRPIGVSTSVVEGIAQALRLSPEERSHLFVLTLQSPPATQLQVESISPALQHLVEEWDVIGPAYITDKRWNIVAWNQSAVALLGDFASMSPKERNMVWFYFTNKAHREISIAWEEHAQLIVSKFRATCSRYLGDMQLQRLIEELQEVSQEFNQWWLRHDVYSRAEGRKEYNHPVVGYVAFDYTVLAPESAPDKSIVLFTPLSEYNTREKFQQLKNSV